MDLMELPFIELSLLRKVTKEQLGFHGVLSTRSQVQVSSEENFALQII